MSTKRIHLIRELEDCGYERDHIDWWSLDALEQELERLTGEQPLTECEETDDE